MIAVILAGGRSSRMKKNVEKPLIEVGGAKIIDRVVKAVKESRAERCIVAVSTLTPNTMRYCREIGCDVLLTEGKGYHDDLTSLLKIHPVFVSAAADMPFLTSQAVDKIINAFDGVSVTGCVPLGTVPSFIEPSYTFEYRGRNLVAVGLNIVTHSELSEVLIFEDPLLAVSVNSERDLEAARRQWLTQNTQLSRYPLSLKS